jgi:hypothetical protein
VSRNIDAFYKDGAFYAVTYALSRKMRHINANPEVGLSKCFITDRTFHEAWMECSGTGNNEGPLKNHAMKDELVDVFKNWINEHTNYNDDLNHIVLKIALKKAVVLDGKHKYAIDFENKTAERFDFAM